MIGRCQGCNTENVEIKWFDPDLSLSVGRFRCSACWHSERICVIAYGVGFPTWEEADSYPYSNSIEASTLYATNPATGRVSSGHFTTVLMVMDRLIRNVSINAVWLQEHISCDAPGIDPEEHNFIVEKREVWTQGVCVRAKTSQEAVDMVRDGQGERIEALLEYSRDLDSDSWTVEVKEN